MSQLNCFAVVVPGLEKPAEAELTELGAENPVSTDGGVTFEASMDTLFRINLRSRIATRILVRLASFSALSFPELYNKCKKVDWSRYIAPDAGVLVRASCQGSKLMHSGRVEKAVLDAIEDKLGCACNTDKQTQQVLLRIENNRVTLSIDSSGERLDRRGYRLAPGLAPIRETIAAAILRWMAWDEQIPLQLPMCGSGTLAVEAAWLATHRASGVGHDFACVNWPGCKTRRWQRAVEKAQAMQRSAKPEIFASDIDVDVIAQARANAETAGVRQLIHFEVGDAFALIPATEKPGMVICNPPYGDRIKADVGSIYAELGGLKRGAFAQWRMAVIVPDKTSEQALGVAIRRRLKFRHGGNWVAVVEI